MSKLAEKYGISKTGLYIMIMLIIVIPSAYFLLPNPNKKVKSLGDSAPGNAYSDRAKTPAGGDANAIADEAAKGQPKAQAAPAPPPAQPQTAAPVAVPVAAPVAAPAAPTTPAQPVAAAAAAGSFSPDKIRRLDPFAPVKKAAVRTAEKASLPLPGPAIPFALTENNYPYVEPSFALNGIYVGEGQGQNIAIINGQIFKQGQTVGNSEYYIEAIDADNLKEVRLRNRRTGDIWPLPFNSGNPSDLVTPAALGQKGGPPPIFNPATNTRLPLPVTPVPPAANQGANAPQ